MTYDISEAMVRSKIEEAERILIEMVLPERVRKSLVMALANARNKDWSIASRFNWLSRAIGKAKRN